MEITKLEQQSRLDSLFSGSANLGSSMIPLNLMDDRMSARQKGTRQINP